MKRLLCAAALALSLALFASPTQARLFPGNDNDRPMNTVESVRRAINDMIVQFGDDYPDGEAYLKELDALEKEEPKDEAWEKKFADFRRKSLLALPELDDLELLVVRSSRLPAVGDDFMTIDKVAKEAGTPNSVSFPISVRTIPRLNRSLSRKTRVRFSNRNSTGTANALCSRVSPKTINAGLSLRSTSTEPGSRPSPRPISPTSISSIRAIPRKDRLSPARTRASRVCRALTAPTPWRIFTLSIRKRKKNLGKSVHVVIIETKLDKAKKLLCESNLSIAEIAHSCGFSNENYFATVFKRQYKLSPTSFRKIQ